MVLSIRKGYQRILQHTEPSSSASTLLSNDAGESSEASSSKQTTTVCTNKQLVTKADVV